MPKQAAYYALHYGAEYLAWSIRSIQDAVDEIHIFYTPTPSYGFGGVDKCPDSEAKLKTEAFRFATKPIHWHVGKWHNEGEHREHALRHLKALGVSHVLVMDADEVWNAEDASACLNSLAFSDAYRWTLWFFNFWRSFNHAVVDAFTPFRLVNLEKPYGGDGHFSQIGQGKPVLHFGYAQSLEIMRYKWTCHGHQRELRNGWLDRFAAWQPNDRDLHPCVNNLWDRAHEVRDPEIIQQLDVELHDHPYRNVDLIE